jgi:hypothetical protein
MDTILSSCEVTDGQREKKYHIVKISKNETYLLRIHHFFIFLSRETRIWAPFASISLIDRATQHTLFLPCSTNSKAGPPLQIEIAMRRVDTRGTRQAHAVRLRLSSLMPGWTILHTYTKSPPNVGLVS